VTAVFREGLDIYFARQQVAERLLEARESMPDDVKPHLGPVATGLGEVYMYIVDFADPAGEGAIVEDGEPGWQSDGTYLTPEGDRLSNIVERAAYLRTIQEWVIAPQLRGVAGVAGIDTIGGHERQYHVQPDPARLIAYNLTFAELIEALEQNNASAGAGFVERGGEALVVRTDGRVHTDEEIGQIVIAEHGGTPIRIRDVAQVVTGRELRSGSASSNGHEVVIGTAIMRLGGNSRTVAGAVDAQMEEVRRSLPRDVVARTVLNRTRLVEATIRTVVKNLAEGAALVIIVLFVMLGHIRAALITALVIPLSMLMAGIGMKQAGISGNLMSLGALDFGIIVDGAVIVVENCLRLLGKRQHALGRPLTLRERLHEVFVATKQMIQPAVFGQAIIITVYVPILALTGVEGKMFHPMALTVIFALVSAFVLSLTFVPAMVAIFVTGKVQEHENWLVAALRRIYQPALQVAIRLRWITVTICVATFVGALAIFRTLGQEFVPNLDEGDVLLQAIRIPSIGIEQATELQRKLDRELSQIPEVEIAFSKTGTAEVAADPMPPNISDTFVMLSPREQWPDPNLTKEELIERIEEIANSLPGSNYEVTQPIQMRFNELIAGVRSEVAVKIFGDEFDVMLPAAEQIASVLTSIPGAQDVKVEQIEGLPSMNIEVDRGAIARTGLTVMDVQDVVAVAIGGREAGVVFEGDRRFDIVIRLPENIRADPLALQNLPIPLPSHDEESVRMMGDRGVGATSSVPLSSVARIHIEEGPNQISRENGKRRVVVQANVRGRDLGGFVAEARQQIAERVELPAGTWLDWGGQFENLEAARKRLSVVLPVAFFLIFVLLFSAFNSVKHALLVFSGVPMALTGGIAALWLTGMPFSISAAVGFIALSGVAVLNGLVMITYINHLRREGVPLDQAILQGAITRLRPVLMTALVASLGFVPMALAQGRGAEVQKPLATVVIGGIITATILTLFVLPALYRIWHRRNEQLIDETDEEHLVRAEPIVT
jgi:cobalt-zinc-cadmium resistance protein CzcA